MKLVNKVIFKKYSNFSEKHWKIKLDLKVAWLILNQINNNF
jgi:hypothetical protein